MNNDPLGANMRAIVAIALCILLIGCGNDEDQYIGFWGTKKNSVHLLKDGTAAITEGGISIAGTWRADDEGGIIITAGMMGINAAMRGVIQDEKLLLDMAGKKVSFEKSSIRLAEEEERKAAELEKDITYVCKGNTTDTRDSTGKHVPSEFRLFYNPKGRTITAVFPSSEERIAWCSKQRKCAFSVEGVSGRFDGPQELFKMSFADGTLTLDAESMKGTFQCKA